jgi:thiol-disulfide isomerase/thioredoxin
MFSPFSSTTSTTTSSSKSSSPLKKTVITDFENVQEFLQLLKSNPGIFMLKLGASWCGPCKQIKPVVDAVFASSPDNVVCADLDIDKKGNTDIYILLKKRIRLTGIPVILMYKKGNHDVIPNESITGSNPNDLHMFFKRCGLHLLEIDKIESKQQLVKQNI